MAATAKITFDGDEYVLRCFTIGELEKVVEITQDESVSAFSRSVRLLGVIAAAIEPPVPDVSKLRATAEEIRIAIETALTISGLQPAKPVEPNPTPPTSESNPAA